MIRITSALICCLTCFAVLGSSLRVVTEDLPPLQIEDSGSSQPTGAMVELVNLLLAEAKLEASVEIYPWARSYQIAQNEPNVLIFSMLRSSSREQNFHWIGKIYQINSFFMRLKSREDIKVNSMNDLKKYAVGAIRHDLAQDYLLDKGFTEDDNLYLSKRYDTLWGHLFQGRTDVVFTNSVIWQYETKQINQDPNRLVKALDITDFSSDLYLAASLKTSPETVEKLKKTLVKIKKDGRYQQIIDKWQL